MVSLGGRGIAYSTTLQLVRTNVLVVETDEMQGFPHLLQAQLMAAQFASDLTTLAGNHGVRTLSLAPLLTDSAIGGGTVVSTGVDAITESSTAAELNDGLAGAAAIVSILAIGRIA